MKEISDRHCRVSAKKNWNKMKQKPGSVQDSFSTLTPESFPAQGEIGDVCVLQFQSNCKMFHSVWPHHGTNGGQMEQMMEQMEAFPFLNCKGLWPLQPLPTLQICDSVKPGHCTINHADLQDKIMEITGSTGPDWQISIIYTKVPSRCLGLQLPSCLFVGLTGWGSWEL